MKNQVTGEKICKKIGQVGSQMKKFPCQESGTERQTFQVNGFFEHHVGASTSMSDC